MEPKENKRNLLIPSTEEIKKKELINLLARLIKNYSKRKEVIKDDSKSA